MLSFSDRISRFAIRILKEIYKLKSMIEVISIIRLRQYVGYPIKCSQPTIDKFFSTSLPNTAKWRCDIDVIRHLSVHGRLENNRARIFVVI